LARFQRRLLLVLAVLVVIVLVIFPIIFELRIEARTLQFGSPSTLAFQISNPDLTPLTDVAYTCEVSKLTLGNGSEDEKAKAIIQSPKTRIIHFAKYARWLYDDPEAVSCTQTTAASTEATAHDNRCGCSRR
jgi:hypothetical protein